MDIAQIIAQRDPADILTCSTQMAVRDAVGLLAGRRVGALPVKEDGRVVGIFSERDVLYKLAEEGALCLDRRIGEVMTAPAIIVTRDTTSAQALALMTKRRIRHLPVVEDGALLGFVSIGDLVKARFEKVQGEAEAMREYIRTA